MMTVKVGTRTSKCIYPEGQKNEEVREAMKRWNEQEIRLGYHKKLEEKNYLRAETN